jgi:hypothetical protein
MDTKTSFIGKMSNIVTCLNRYGKFYTLRDVILNITVGIIEKEGSFHRHPSPGAPVFHKTGLK